MDIAEIKTRLAARVESVVETLLPNGRRVGAEWCVGSVDGEKGQSLRVHLAGDKSGIWADFAEGGRGGDLLDLYCAVKGVDLPAALDWAKDYLGIAPDVKLQSAAERTYRKPVRRAGVKAPQSAAKAYLMQNRALNGDTLAKFKVAELDAMEFDVAGNKITSPAIVFPFIVEGELRFVKYLGTERTAEGKKLIKAEAGCEPVLFGWQAVPPNSRTVVICEGEINAMTWFQYGYAALATPFGAGKGAKHAWVDREWERLERFETIYLDFDQDAPGREAVAELSQRLGIHRCRVVPAKPDGLKDINDCLFAGLSIEAIDAMAEKSRSVDPPELRQASDFLDDVMDEFYPPESEAQRLKLPFPSLAGKWDLRMNELSLWVGYSGHGKTQLLTYLHNVIAFQGEPTLEASMEMPIKRMVRRKVRQLTGQKEPSRAYVRQVVEWMAGRVWFYDKLGSAQWRRILEVFEYAYRRYGIRHFVIDSLMKCGIAEDDYQGQKVFVDALSAFVNTYPVHVHLVTHSRKQDDEDDPPGKFDVRGGAILTDMAHNVIAVWRNKAKEQVVEAVEVRKETVSDSMAKKLDEPDALMLLRKQREGDGEEPTIKLYFHKDSQQYSENAAALGTPIIPFEVPDGKAAPEFEEIPEF